MPDTFKGTSIRLMLRLLGFYTLYSTLKYLQRKARNQVPATASGVPKVAGVLRRLPANPVNKAFYVYYQSWSLRFKMLV